LGICVRADIGQNLCAVIKTGSIAHEYTGIDNPLFYMDRTMMVFGNANNVVEQIVKALD
jgi:NAD(P) transhydrogenase subunit beta